MRTVDSRPNRLFLILTGFFLTNALIGEFVGKGWLKTQRGALSIVDLFALRGVVVRAKIDSK